MTRKELNRKIRLIMKSHGVWAFYPQDLKEILALISRHTVMKTKDYMGKPSEANQIRTKGFLGYKRQLLLTDQKKKDLAYWNKRAQSLKASTPRKKK